MDPRTKFRDLISLGDLGTNAATRTATVTPRPPSDPDSNMGGAYSEAEEYSGRYRAPEEELSLGDGDAHPVRERASDPLFDNAPRDGSPSKKEGATSGSRDDLPIEGADAGGVGIGMHDDQRFDGSEVGEYGPAQTPVTVGAFDAGNDTTNSATPTFLLQHGGQGVFMVDGGDARIQLGDDNGDAIVDGVKTLHEIDVDLALYMPINIEIAVNSSTPQYTASMAGDELFKGNPFTLPYKATDFSSLGQHNFSVSDNDAVSSSGANSGGNSLFGGLVAINAGNPAISIALAINDASISQSNSAPGVGEPMVNKPFGSLETGNLNLSDHDASSLSLANSGSNSVLGGLLALSVGNPAISQALSINLAPMEQGNIGLDFDSDHPSH
jgi:hypothetical protein